MHHGPRNIKVNTEKAMLSVGVRLIRRIRPREKVGTSMQLVSCPFSAERRCLCCTVCNLFDTQMSDLHREGRSRIIGISGEVPTTPLGLMVKVRVRLGVGFRVRVRI